MGLQLNNQYIFKKTELSIKSKVSSLLLFYISCRITRHCITWRRKLQRHSKYNTNNKKVAKCAQTKPGVNNTANKG